MIIYLPGNSPLNRDELDLFEGFLLEKMQDVYAHEYKHWNEEGEKFHLQTEIERVKDAVKEVEFEEYGIIAKSIGTWTAVNLVRNLPLKKPKFIVLMGVPSELSSDNFDTYRNNLKESGAKIFVINNEKDPFVDHETVASILDGIKHEKVVVPENDTHRYPNTEEVWELIKELV